MNPLVAAVIWPLVTTLLLGVAGISAIGYFLGLFAGDPELVLYLKTLAITGSLGGLISGLIRHERRFVLASWPLDADARPPRIECGALADAVIGIGGAWGVFFVLGRSMRLGSATADLLTIIGLGVVAGFSARALLATLRERILGEARSVAEETAKETVKAQAKESVTYTDMTHVATLIKVSDAAPAPEAKTELLEGAEARVNEVLAREPTNVSALLMLAAIRKRQAWLELSVDKRNVLLDEAIMLCSRVIELRPSQGQAHYNRACYKCLRGTAIAEVLVDLDKAVELVPEWKAIVKGDPDLEHCRSDPRFKARYE